MAQVMILTLIEKSQFRLIWYNMNLSHIDRWTSVAQSQDGLHQIKSHVWTWISTRLIGDINLACADLWSWFGTCIGLTRHNSPMNLKKQLAQAGISRQSWQQEFLDRDSWRSSLRKASCEFEAKRYKAAKGKTQEAERASSIPAILIPNLCLFKVW